MANQVAKHQALVLLALKEVHPPPSWNEAGVRSGKDPALLLSLHPGQVRAPGQWAAQAWHQLRWHGLFAEAAWESSGLAHGSVRAQGSWGGGGGCCLPSEQPSGLLGSREKLRECEAPGSPTRLVVQVTEGARGSFPNKSTPLNPVIRVFFKFTKNQCKE